MARMLWLADVLRAAGLTVVETSGWRTRGSDDFDPRGVIDHETRGSLTSTDVGEINVLINGRVGLSGPIAQLYLSRTGTWHVIASGRCNHVLTGWSGPFAGLGNRSLLGVEAQHAAGEPWTPVQYQSYVRGVAAIVRHTGWPAPVGHKEHQAGDKPDPAFDMNTFRRDVAAAQMGDDMDLYASKSTAKGLAGRSHGQMLDDLFSEVITGGSHNDGRAYNTASKLAAIATAVKTPAAIDHNLLADAIVAKLPTTSLTAADVKAALADVLRNGVAPTSAS